MVWFHHTHKDQEPHQYILLYCPVCKKEIGFRWKHEIKTFPCDECKADFTFYPGMNKPTSELHTKKNNQCKCPSCQARRERA